MTKQKEEKPEEAKPEEKAVEKLNVYQCIARIQGELAVTGVAKDRQGTGQFNYKFRGIDDMYNALAPLLAKYELCILPFVVNRSVTERASKSGGVLFYTVVDVDFHFISSADGSKHTVKMYGEAMDSGDKSTNKAMSAAYKYAVMQAFCIPVEGQSADTENDTHTDIQPVVQQQTYAPKEDYVVKLPITEEGNPDFDAFAAELEDRIPKAQTLQDVSMLNRANAKNMRLMQDERPDLFQYIGAMFRTRSNEIGG